MKFRKWYNKRGEEGCLQPYSKSGETVDKRMRISALDQIFSKIPLGGENALDVGCGNGRICRFLASKYKNVVGIDKYVLPDDRFKKSNIKYFPVGFEDFESEFAFDMILFLGSFFIFKGINSKDDQGLEEALIKSKSLLSPSGQILIMDEIKRCESSHSDGGNYNLEDLANRVNIEVINDFEQDNGYLRAYILTC